MPNDSFSDWDEELDKIDLIERWGDESDDKEAALVLSGLRGVTLEVRRGIMDRECEERKRIVRIELLHAASRFSQNMHTIYMYYVSSIYRRFSDSQ